MYLQDKFQVTPTLSLTAGHSLRLGWRPDRKGRDASSTSTQRSTNTTRQPTYDQQSRLHHRRQQHQRHLRGQQHDPHRAAVGYRTAPRRRLVNQPEEFNGKVVVRAGFGMYYDRGELFSYFSPGYAIGTVTGGPFGVNQQLPFVTAQTCPPATAAITRATFPPAVARMPDRQSWPTPTEARRPMRARRRIPKSSDLTNYLPNLASHQQRRTAHLARRLRSRQQASVHLQLHAGHTVAAAQRPLAVDSAMSAIWAGTR